MKVALISGASSGLGLSLANYLVKNGFKVFAGARDPKRASKQNPDVSDQLEWIKLDVKDQANVTEVAKSIAQQMKKKTFEFYLINNAGVCVASPLELVETSDYDEQFDVNVRGLICLTSACMDLVRTSHGRIVNIGSASGHLAMPYYGLYAASKFAVRAISDSLRRELMVFDVPVILVEPGSIVTPIWQKLRTDAEKRFEASKHPKKEIYKKDFQKFLQANEKLAKEQSTTEEDFCEVVLTALTEKKPKAAYTVGRDAWLCKNVYEKLPSKIVDRALKKTMK